jgi:hypothetical protein
MNRKLRVLGLALVAVFAMSVVAASAAQAAQFTSSSAGPISGEQIGEVNEFTTDVGQVECEIGTFTGTAATAASTQTINANYEECLVGGLVPATVSMGTCDYLFKATGKVDVVCGVGGKITVLAGKCTITVGPQTELGNVTYENNGSHLLVKAAVTGIKYTLDTGCNPTGERSNGTYTSEVTMQRPGGTLSFDP